MELLVDEKIARGAVDPNGFRCRAKGVEGASANADVPLHSCGGRSPIDAASLPFPSNSAWPVVAAGVTCS